MAVDLGLEERPKAACVLPSETGKCRAAFPKYFYNVDTGKCERFTYGLVKKIQNFQTFFDIF